MRTRLLLDTCAMFYTSEGSLNGSALAAMNDAFAASEDVSVSTISAWEIGLLAARGRLPTTSPPLHYFERFVALPGIRSISPNAEIFVASSFLPGPIHRDPADRIIIATARALGLTIMTSDRLILDYAQQGHVRALPC